MDCGPLKSEVITQGQPAKIPRPASLQRYEGCHFEVELVTHFRQKMSKSMQIRKEKEVISFPDPLDLRLLIAEILFDMFKYKQKT